MNPLLLNMSQDQGVNMVLHGKEIKGKNFNDMRAHFFEEVFAAYERLRSQYEIVVVEGAGSPVELNLMENDIVNMNFAMRAKTPVLLVGEINRGGVFASVYGTLALLSKEQHQLVKGVLINKFIGDPKLFEDGCKIMEEIICLPVLGVLPYTQVEIEDEDSFAEGRPKTKETLYQDVDFENVGMSLIDVAIEELATVMEKYIDMKMVKKVIEEGA
jgi:adenosylcobyric acid synthase